MKTNSVIVYFNNGAGGFADVPASIGVGDDPFDVKAADVNNDGKLDVISADEAGGIGQHRPGQRQGGLPDRPILRRGQARPHHRGGRFQRRREARHRLRDDDGKLTVLVGKGDGTFSGGRSIPLVTKGIWDIAIADFNGDGKADFALTTANVLGDPRRSRASTWATGTPPSAPRSTRRSLGQLLARPGRLQWRRAAGPVSTVYPDFDVLLNDGKWSGL